MSTVQELLDEGAKAHNFRVIKIKIMELIAYEPDENAKLEMLTSISITTQNDDIWNASEEVRDELFKGSSISKEDLLANLPKPSSTEGEVEGAVDADYGKYGEDLGHGMFT